MISQAIIRCIQKVGKRNKVKNDGGSKMVIALTIREMNYLMAGYFTLLFLFAFVMLSLPLDFGFARKKTILFPKDMRPIPVPYLAIFLKKCYL